MESSAGNFSGVIFIDDGIVQGLGKGFYTGETFHRGIIHRCIFHGENGGFPDIIGKTIKNQIRKKQAFSTESKGQQ